MLTPMQANDTVKLDLETGKIVEFFKFDTGSLVTLTAGRNTGRVGNIVSRERHPGQFDIVHVKDVNNHTFATRLQNVFVIGSGNKPAVSLLPSRGVKLSVIEERDRRLQKLRESA